MEYTKPELEIVLLDNLYDIVTTSPGGKLQDGGSGGSEGGNWTDFI